MLIKEELKKVPPCGCPEFTEEELKDAEYIVAAKVLEVQKCGEILVADYYSADGFNLQVRFFSDRNNWISYLPKTDKWTSRTLTSLFNFYHNAIPCKEKSENAATKFFGLKKSSYDSGWYISMKGYIYRLTGVYGACSEFIREQEEEKRYNARLAKEHKMKERLSWFPESYSNEVDIFLEEQAFKQTYIFISNLDSKKRRQAVCGHCGKKFKVGKEAKHNQFTECPYCHKKAVYCAVRYRENQEDETIVCYPMKHDNQLIVQWKTAVRWFNNKFQPCYGYSDIGSTFYLENSRRKIQSYGLSRKPYYWGDTWCDWGDTPIYRSAFVFPNNLNDIFGEKYYNVNLYELLKEQNNPIDFISLLDNLKNYPIAEYLCKTGLISIASERELSISKDININGKNFQSVFCIAANYRELYTKYNVSLKEHRIIKKSKEFVTKDLLEKYRHFSQHNKSYFNISELFEYMTLNKALTYIIKQQKITCEKNLGRIAIWLRDYIETSKRLGVSLNKSNMFPADIKTSHDLVVERFNKIAQEIQDAESKAALALVNEFFKGYETEKLLIKVPKVRGDFIKEGQELNHCVGQDRYYEGHIKGDRMIFFVRKTENPDKSFFTAEIDMHDFRIVQLYGNHDCTAPKEIKEFTKKFALWLKSQSESLQKAG